MKSITVKSFAELARELHKQDVKRAENLRKSRPLARGKVGRIAR